MEYTVAVTRPVELKILRRVAYLHIDLVTTQHNRDVLANTLKITMPVGHVLVGDTRGYIEHDDTALSLNVVSITETTKLLLSGCIPNVEADRAEVC